MELLPAQQYPRRQNFKRNKYTQQNVLNNNYSEAIKTIKQAMLKSRYRAAAMVNREMLSLYFGVGEYISNNSRKDFWGTNAIEIISQQLQKELPGLRGFSATNMKNMRLFYGAWSSIFSNRQLSTDDLKTNQSLCHFDSIGFTLLYYYYYYY
ncbi:MAG: DUF1016 N-terminal domain-containing protein [Planctomycetaceae bacterium]|jgi:hypothetical protein|nr:DUF1016 N-terminal domain-containing protein [Planctomycetaceae bacterium]